MVSFDRPKLDTILEKPKHKPEAIISLLETETPQAEIIIEQITSGAPHELSDLVEDGFIQADKQANIFEVERDAQINSELSQINEEAAVATTKLLESVTITTQESPSLWAKVKEVVARATSEIKVQFAYIRATTGSFDILDSFTPEECRSFANLIADRHNLVKGMANLFDNQLIKRLKGLDQEIAIKWIEKGQENVFLNNITSFERLGNKEAELYIASKKITEFALRIEHFENLNKNVADALIKDGFHMVILLNLERFDDSIDLTSIKKLIESNTQVAQRLENLLKPGGPLHSNLDNVRRTISGSNNPIATTKAIEQAFSKPQPTWKMYSAFTFIRYGVGLINIDNPSPISKIAGIPLTELVNNKRIASIIKNKTVLDELKNGTRTEVTFNDLSDKYKLLVYREKLRTCILDSNNPQKKENANQRNRTEIKEQKPYLSVNTLIHAGSIDSINEVLYNGLLAGESLGERSRIDYTPFRVDIGIVQQEQINKYHGNPREIIASSIVKHYGKSGKLGRDGQVIYILNRTPESYEAGKETEGLHIDAKLILAGIPSTEISGIILNSPEIILKQTTESIIKNGFYIPVYDKDGKLLFTPEEYDELLTKQEK